jgi:membrane protein
MFVDNKFYNHVYQIRKKSFWRYFLLYLFLQLLITILSDFQAIQMILTDNISQLNFFEVVQSSFLLSFISSIIMQFFTLLILMQIYRIAQGSYTKLIDLFEPVKEKWLIILCISSFIAFLDNLFAYFISNTFLLLIPKLVLYYLTIFIAFAIYTYPPHAYQDAIRHSIKEAIDSFKDMIKMDIHYIWICLAAFLFTLVIIFPIIKTIFGGTVLIPLVTLEDPSSLYTITKSMIPLITAMFIPLLIVLILTQYRVFCAYYAHALYYFYKYVEIKPDESETLTQSTESTYEIDKNEDA